MAIKRVGPVVCIQNVNLSVELCHMGHQRTVSGALDVLST